MFTCRAGCDQVQVPGWETGASLTFYFSLFGGRHSAGGLLTGWAEQRETVKTRQTPPLIRNQQKIFLSTEIIYQREAGWAGLVWACEPLLLVLKVTEDSPLWSEWSEWSQSAVSSSNSVKNPPRTAGRYDAARYQLVDRLLWSDAVQCSAPVLLLEWQSGASNDVSCNDPSHTTHILTLITLSLLPPSSSS